MNEKLNLTKWNEMSLKSPNEANVIFLSRIHSRNYYLHKPVMADHWHKIVILGLIIVLLFVFLLIIYYQRVLFQFICHWIDRRKGNSVDDENENLQILHHTFQSTEFSHMESTHKSKTQH